MLLFLDLENQNQQLPISSLERGLHKGIKVETAVNFNSKQMLLLL